MNVDNYVAGVIGTIIAFAIYGLARRRADAGAPRTQSGRPWVRRGAGWLIVPFLLAWAILGAIDYVSGGALSHADRFWAGLALGIGIGALVVTAITQRRDRARAS
jgi:hypothetical protein